MNKLFQPPHNWSLIAPILCLIVILLSGCFRERIELDYNDDENKKLVITGWITTLDEPQFIEVSNTVNYLGAFTPDGASGAEVSLSDETNSYILVEGDKGKYFLPETWTAKVGDNYKLKVKYEGKEYTAEHQMYPCPEIENFDFAITEDLEDTDSTHIYATYFSFEDFEGEGDAYYGIDYRKGSPDQDTLTNGDFANDEFMDGLFFEDISLSESDRLFAMGDTAVLELHSISTPTAEFLQDIINEIFRGSPFDAPPANIRTNISGGAIGYFIMADARRATQVIQ